MNSTKELNYKLFAEMHVTETENTVKGSNEQFAKLNATGLSIDFDNGESIKFPNLTITNGEKILLMGDSGSGKSTLVKLLTGNLQPKSGSINYINENGEVINNPSSFFSYLPQDATLFPDTIANNITMFNDHLLNQVPEIVQQVELDNDIHKFDAGLATKLDLDHMTLSGGQQQKVVLARAEVHNKPILFIDEGTSAIDRMGTKKILSRLLSSDLTIMFIAHNFDDELEGMFSRKVELK
ncbi:ATP-binding cassette domain-containing protein [Apilactobacillus xinyiensis]|uniref:ATP-binding cassette domain-containing protein n=1 Tax=Apilactobacillus xinyiensis TaxID=2841032 RepID=UPI001C7DDCB6|nr:ATP-binding cassette domain-containing protein [Apilactobacillus xinyiensis]